ncbi:MAG: biopolymer transporter ExbD [Myxococcota bacterium]|nr:biopolymer transporter ExbD [Myxococcota bacterium]
MPVKRRPLDEYEGDPLIPIMNLVCMLIPLLLYGAVFVRFITLEVNSPKMTNAPVEPPPDQAEKLNLTVMITDQGFHFKVNPRYRLPWMSMATETASAGPDIPKKDDDWDYEELNKRLKELKENHREERQLILGAEDDIQFEVLIRAMDYSRGEETNELFPDVTLTRGVV